MGYKLESLLSVSDDTNSEANIQIPGLKSSILESIADTLEDLEVK